jgi:hypothetical protein
MLAKNAAKSFAKGCERKAQIRAALMALGSADADQSSASRADLRAALLLPSAAE